MNQITGRRSFRAFIIVFVIFFICFGSIISKAHFNVASIQRILIIAWEIVFTPKLDKSKISHIKSENNQPINIAVCEPVISSAILTTDFLFTMIQIHTTTKIGPRSFTIKVRSSICKKLLYKHNQSMSYFL